MNQCHFSLRTITQTQLADGYRIVITTDIPCHLYMRWSTTPPQYHTIPVYRRGIYMHGDRYICFTVYQDNQQEEAGDTLEHTFVKVTWPHCQTRYFYFWGKVADQVCVSTTAVFEKHFTAPTIYDAAPCWHNRRLYSSHAIWTTARNGYGVIKFPYYQRPTNELMAGTWLIATYDIYRAYQNFNTVDKAPLGPIIAAQLGLFPTSKSAGDFTLIITKGLWDEPVTAEDWQLQTEETTILGSISTADITLNQYNWIELNQAGLDWLDNSDLKLKQWESYDWWKSAYFQTYGANRWSQSFTPVYSHNLWKLKLRLKRIGNAGQFFVNIKDTTPGGCPSGDPLKQAYSYAILLSDATWGDWYELTFPSRLWVEAGHAYTLELFAPDGNSSNRVEWIGATGTPYPNGHACYSTDDGHTWISTPTYALYFIEYQVNYMEAGTVPPREKVGGTNLCLRASADVSDAPPGGGVEYWLKYHSAQKGDGYKPLLRLYIGKY